MIHPKIIIRFNTDLLFRFVNQEFSEGDIPTISENKDIFTQGTSSKVLKDDEFTKDTVKENRLRRRKETKLRRKEAENATKDNYQQLKEASATDS